MALIEQAKLSYDYIYTSDTERIKRVAEVLFSIRAGSLPMDRNFGLEQDFVGMPMSVAQNLYALEATTKIEKYIPEAKIIEIKYEFDETDGRMFPNIKLGSK